MVQVSADHLISTSGKEPQRTNNFILEFGKFVPATKLYLSGVAFPNYSAQVEELRQVNLMMKFPVATAYGDIRVTIYDIVQEDVAKQLEQWWTAIVGAQRKFIAVPTQFKDTATLSWTDGCGESLRSWQLIGCFPKNIEFGEGNMESVSPVQIQLTLSVDLIKRQ